MPTIIYDLYERKRRQKDKKAPRMNPFKGTLGAKLTITVNWQNALHSFVLMESTGALKKTLSHLCNFRSQEETLNGRLILLPLKRMVLVNTVSILKLQIL